MESICPPLFVTNDSTWLIHQSKNTTWTKEENKLFESALAFFDEHTQNRWLKVAALVPGKSEFDVMYQYLKLESDVNNIEAGLVPIPGYLGSSFTLELEDDHRVLDGCRKRGRVCAQERKKGVPWTEDEHRRFLLGLEKHGKGDWRSISRNFVITKTPTQVASHAQKYYLRQHSGGKDKRRPSIHDIRTVDLSNATLSHDSNKVPRLEKHGALTRSMQMVLDSTIDPFVACPRNVASHNRYFVNIGPDLHLQSSRFHGN